MLASTFGMVLTDSSGNQYFVEANPGFVSLTGSNTLYPNTFNATNAANVIGGNQPCSEVLLQASNKNTDMILIGNATSQVIELNPGASVSVPCSNVNLLYAIANSGTQKLNYLARS